MSAIVLVGGSFLGGWAYEKVTPRLQAAGHQVYPLTLTGAGDRYHLATADTGLNLNAADIVHAIEYAGLRDVVLVAHSYSGAPATLAAAQIPDRIARLVYLAGAIPVPGRSLFEAAGPEYEEAVRATAVDGFVPVMSDDILDFVFGDHGLTQEDRAYLRARGTAQPLGTFTDRAPADLGGIDKVARTYIVCTRDPGEPPVDKTTPGFELDHLDSGHWPMITRPDALTEVILRWA